MIFKVHIQDFSHIGQGSVCSVEQIVFANVVLWLYPLSLEYSPKRFREVEMGRVRGKKKEELFDVDAQLDALFGVEGTPKRAAAESKAYAFFYRADHRRGREESVYDARRTRCKNRNE